MSILKTIYLQHLNGANANMTLDSSGNIGVGNTSPQYRLDVTDNTTGQQLRVSSSHGNGTSMGFVSSSTNGRTWRIGSNYVDGLGEFAIYDATSSANRLNINSSGYVTMPNQPRFDVYRPSNQAFSGSGVATVAYDTKVYDTTNSFNTSTNTFTAPVAGTYFFRWQCMMMNLTSVSFITLNLYINGGGNEEFMISGFRSDYNTMSFNCFRPMSAGDTADIRIYYNSVNAGAYVRGGSSMNRFKGILIS